MKRAFFLAMAVLLLAPAAGAHRGTTAKGYVSTIAGLKPNVLGVFVNVLGGDDQLRLSNYSRKTIVVLGYDGEPYLRFRGSSVFVNAASPDATINKVRYPPKVTVSLSGPPVWRQVSSSPSYAWHDHRIHWTERTPPPAVEKEPDKVHKLFDWRVPALADGKPFEIKGFLGYVPPPGVSKNGKSGWVFPAVFGGLTVALIAALAVWVGARHREGRRAP